MRRILKEKASLLLLFFIPILGFTLFFIKQPTQTKSQPNNSDVLGSSRYQYPQIYISGGEHSYSNGGLIALASTDEPAVVIGGYNLSGDADITMYEADEDSMLNYLIHDKDGKQIYKNPDVSKFHYVTNTQHSINTSTYQGSKVPLPLRDSGIWYLKVKIGGIQADAFVLRSNIGVLTKEGDNEFIFWGQNFKTKRSISAGTVKILNLQDSKKELQTVSFNAEGIARANLTSEADIALVTQDNDKAIVPINLRYLNSYSYDYKQFQEKNKLTRYFIFTDRPLYKPGDTVYFKTVLRDDDDATYTIPSGEAQVKIYSDYNKKVAVLDKSFPISADGTIDDQYKLPEDAKIGSYSLVVSLPNSKNTGSRFHGDWASNSVYFNVEYFKKPEFTIDVTTPISEAIAGDKTSFKISGAYYSGQPLIGQKVKYVVYSADYYEYQYLMDQQTYQINLSNDYRYGYWYGEHKVLEGSSTLNSKGEAEIALDTKMDFNKGKSQVFSIETTIDDGSQTPAFSRKNILVYGGQYGIYRKDSSYGVQVNTPLKLPIILIPNKNNKLSSSYNLTAKVHRTTWTVYQDPAQKYPATKKEEEDLPSLTASTDQNGNATFEFTPSKIGSYTLTVEGQDSRGNLISKIFYAYVSAEDQPYYSDTGDNDITLSTDKQKYQPTDTARLNIFSQTPDRDAFLSLERGRVHTYKVLHLNGKNGSIDIPLVDSDIPDIFAKVSSFSSTTLDENQIKIPVSSDSKKVIVSITPNSQNFGPGETVTVNVATTDTGGNPISADVALWTVDKAIFALSDNKLGDIFQTFWFDRYNSTQETHSLEGILVRTAEMGGGCFGPGTKVLMADGSTKNIEEVKTGDYIFSRASKTDSTLFKAKVTGTHSAEEAGTLIINGHLKVTANHIMFVNNTWKEAGSIQTGDSLTNSQGNLVKVTSIEWQKGKTNVYNLEVEKYHTFFANGVWVHNEKGIERNAFKDTAYWNPSLHTDINGRAQVSFKLPDNLTTWTLAAVAATADTKVGQATNEIKVNKDVIARPILPNILRVDDEAYLSALVQNFTPNPHQFDIDLKFDSGTVEQAALKDIQIKSNDMQQLYWKVKPNKENRNAKLTFAARVKDDPKLADIVTEEIPVKAFGFEQRWGLAGEGNKTYDFKLAPDTNKEKSKITLSLGSNIVGSLPSSMRYLIDYPYGCVEQTTSRFVPAVIAKANKQLFTESLKDKNIDDIIKKGITKLTNMQNWDGGWAWWYSGDSQPFLTSYVVEYLLAAKQAGATVDEGVLNKAKDFLKSDKTQTAEMTIIKNYTLKLLGEKVDKISSFNYLTTDLVALAVMTNYLNGDTNPQSNGMQDLISRARIQGDGAFWPAGDKINYGSDNASTAMAVRTILLAGGDKTIAAKGVKYLTRNRQLDYWTNTFATAQIIRAFVDYSKVSEELKPNYTYTVLLDGKQIAQGTVSDPKQTIPDLNIPTQNIKAEGSKITINKTGDGQIYSTLTAVEFHTDKNAKAQNQGLQVSRTYENEQGPEYSLGVGDTAIVKITLNGLYADEYYGVIKDELPAGLVPVNESFKNEQYGQKPQSGYDSNQVSDQQVTENGMVLSLYKVGAGQRTYTYRARVVSEGTFIAPPATASLMYTPEISGRSDVQTLKIAKKSAVVGKKQVPQPANQILSQKDRLIIAGIIIAAIAGGVATTMILKRRRSTPPNKQL